MASQEDFECDLRHSFCVAPSSWILSSKMELDIGISLTGLVNFVSTIWLRSPCAGENDAINTWIITKPVNPTTFSSVDATNFSPIVPWQRPVHHCTVFRFRSMWSGRFLGRGRSNNETGPKYPSTLQTYHPFGIFWTRQIPDIAKAVNMHATQRMIFLRAIDCPLVKICRGKPWLRLCAWPWPFVRRVSARTWDKWIKIYGGC